MVTEEEYLHFDDYDFVRDKYFIKWAKGDNPFNNVFWETFLLKHPHKIQAIENAKHVVLAFQDGSVSISDRDIATIRENLLKVVKAETQHRAVPNPILYKKESRKSAWYRVAAVLSGLIIISSLFLLINTLSGKFRYDETAYGESRTVVLPDQSVVVLNAKSQIRYQKEWNSNDAREIWLEGEAYFNVTHQPNNQKFIVHTRGVNIEVLGTSFNVKNRRKRTKVILETGEVRLNMDIKTSADKALIMKPGDYVMYSEEKKDVIIKKVDPKIYISWVQNKFLFQNTTLKEIAQLLEDNYGYKVRFTDASAGLETITGEISAKNPELIIQAISESLGLQIEVENKSILIGSN